MKRARTSARPSWTRGGRPTRFRGSSERSRPPPATRPPTSISASLSTVRGGSRTPLREFAAAVALGPDDAESREALGLTLSELGRAGDALPEFEAAARLAPDSAAARENLALALAEAGRHARRNPGISGGAAPQAGLRGGAREPGRRPGVDGRSRRGRRTHERSREAPTRPRGFPRDAGRPAHRPGPWRGCARRVRTGRQACARFARRRVRARPGVRQERPLAGGAASPGEGGGHRPRGPTRRRPSPRSKAPSRPAKRAWLEGRPRVGYRSLRWNCRYATPTSTAATPASTPRSNATGAVPLATERPGK